MSRKTYVSIGPMPIPMLNLRLRMRNTRNRIIQLSDLTELKRKIGNCEFLRVGEYNISTPPRGGGKRIETKRTRITAIERVGGERQIRTSLRKGTSGVYLIRVAEQVIIIFPVLHRPASTSTSRDLRTVLRTKEYLYQLFYDRDHCPTYRYLRYYLSSF